MCALYDKKTQNMITLSQSTATIISIFLVSLIGTIIGKIKIHGISLGVAAILFAGIVFSACGVSTNGDMLSILKDIGLVLFIYTLGLHVGPDFSSSFRSSGLTMNLVALAIVVLGVLMTFVVSRLTGIPLGEMAGIYSGAISSTPGMSAAQQSATDPVIAEKIVNGYALTYPVGVMVPIFICLSIRRICKINIKNESIEENGEPSSQANEEQAKEEPGVNLIPVFGGVLAGVLLGSIAITLKSGVSLKLGLAGGAMIASMVIGAVGTKRNWISKEFIVGKGMTTLREFGVSIFMAAVGLESGESFLSNLNLDGLVMILCALIIAIIPLLVVSLFSRIVLKMNYFTLIGLAGGATTDTPALAFANNMADNPENKLPATAYSMVYPLTVIMRILTAQLLVLASTII